MCLYCLNIVSHIFQLLQYLCLCLRVKGGKGEKGGNVVNLMKINKLNLHSIKPEKAQLKSGSKEKNSFG